MCPSGQGRTAVADCLEVKYINQSINQSCKSYLSSLVSHSLLTPPSFLSLSSLSLTVSTLLGTLLAIAQERAMCMRMCDVHWQFMDFSILCVNFRLHDGPRSMVELATSSLGLAQAHPNKNFF